MQLHAGERYRSQFMALRVSVTRPSRLALQVAFAPDDQFNRVMHPNGASSVYGFHRALNALMISERAPPLLS